MTSAAAPDGQSAARDAQDPRRVDREHFDQACDIDFPAMNQMFERNAQRGFQADDTERALLKLLHFFAARVRRMIRGDRVDSSVDDALDNRVHIARRPQRRLHLIVAVVGDHAGIGQSQMMRRRFRCDRKPFELRECNHLH